VLILQKKKTVEKENNSQNHQEKCDMKLHYL